MLSQFLMIASGGIVFTFGTIHLIYTFRGPKLTPRDPSLQKAMREVSPVITRETTMWKTWIGFNATHSMGLMLLGLVYAYLAAWHADLLFRSPFLVILGLVTLLAYTLLAKAYFFSVPFLGVCTSLALYGLAVALAFVMKQSH